MEETLLAASRERQRQVQDVTGHSECSLKHNKNIICFVSLMTQSIISESIKTNVITMC